jgi:hypothetical protein
MSTTISGTNGVTFPDSTSMQTGQQACKAWVNFNGTSTVAIRAAYNVSTITDNGTGDYTVNFTTAMVDANYSAVSSQAYNDNVVSPSNVTHSPLNNNFTTGSFRLSTPNGAGSPVDSTYVYAAIFR